MLDKLEFRDAMSRLGAAVNIITSDGTAGRAGCTASAVCSVTDDPPTLLVCINRASRNNATFRQNGRLCVNVLASDQQDIALRFADRSLPVDQRFILGDWEAGDGRPPVLRHAATSLECEISAVSEVGTHSVFFCTVTATRTRNESDGLIYFARTFHSVGAQASIGAA